MENIDVTKLTPGEKLLVKTESGSIYHLEAETTPESVGTSEFLFRGFRATRESDHQLSGRLESIEDEPAIIAIFSDERGILQAGKRMEVFWDSDHPENETEWDWRLGEKFNPITTTRILDIELVPVEE